MGRVDDLIDLEKTYCANNYLPIPVVLERSKGVWAWDVNGKKYLDMMSAYSAVSHGHSHPRIIKKLQEQSEKCCLVSRAYYTDTLGPLLKKLCEMTGFDRALPMNTGAEAVETALKAARRWGHMVKGIPDGQQEIIVAENNFHGRTTTIISFSSEPAYQKGFAPLTPGFKQVPFADVAALDAAIGPNTCAFLVEPVQGEAGIVVPYHDYLKQVRAVCHKHNIMMIVDEVQSGFGRTGKMFAFEHSGIRPDGMVLGKALGGGVLPISALVGTQELMGVFTPGSHGSTFGGNPLAAAVALEGLHVLEEEGLVENSARLGAHMQQRFHAFKSPLIQDIRGIGLWVGLEIDPKYASARQVCERLAEHGVLSKETHDVVVRIAPPLVITQEELDYGIDVIGEVLRSFEL